eukprot:TRINITY_DN43946_c0_g1_i1.p1 TRINITY_DN43946_c0_g1~~TRINITY_DN43946_c0_g1_i1.p1  ORF type:complete len:338 (-),score=47.24 TRINITY_DN43946_c0_g1_i1:19-1032(-)
MAALDFAAMVREEKRKAAAAKMKLQASEQVDRGPCSEIQLGRFALHGRCSSLWYIPDYVTAAEEARLLEGVSTSESRWIQLTQRRLQTWGGTPHPSGMVPQALPLFLTGLMNGISVAAPSLFPEPPDHVLLNEYTDEQGIAPHMDGPMYQQTVAVLSLVGPAMFELELNGDRQTVMLMPRSLICFTGDAYLKWRHSIPTRKDDTIDDACVNRDLAGVALGATIPRASRRVSITMRRVAVPKLEEDFTEAGREESQRRTAWFRSSVNEGGTGAKASSLTTATAAGSSVSRGGGGGGYGGGGGLFSIGDDEQTETLASESAQCTGRERKEKDQDTEADA